MMLNFWPNFSSNVELLHALFIIKNFPIVDHAGKTDGESKEPRISPEERRRQIEEEKARKKRERQEVSTELFKYYVRMKR